MKKSIIISVLLILACCKTKTTSNLIIDKNEISTYKIKKIDSIENVYIIYARKTDSLFKIVSVKTESNDCKKIEVGKSYNFELKTAFINKTTSPLHLAGIIYHNTPINLERDSINDIYTSVNLKGLCYEKQ